MRLLGPGARVTVVDSLAPGCGGNRENLESFIDAVQTSGFCSGVEKALGLFSGLD